MEIYFLIGLCFILFNIIFIILTSKLKRSEFIFDTKFETAEFPYGFKLVGIIISIIIFIFGFIIEYLNANCLSSLFIPGFIGYPIYYYFLFICNHTKPEHIRKKEFFYTMFSFVSLFYLLFLPLAKDVSLSYQLSLIISTNFPLLELVIIVYVNLFVYALLLNIILYFDAYNYIIRKKNISSQLFRKQHSLLSIIAFIISGYIASIILNSQFLTYPTSFDFNKFQNIILIYQIFLSSITILISLNNIKKKNYKN